MKQQGCPPVLKWMALAATSAALMLVVTQHPAAAGWGPAGAAAPTASSAYCTWTPYQLTKEQQIAAIKAVSIDYKGTTLVSAIRMLLSAQMAIGAIANDVPGDFVETGTMQGGTTILMMKILQEFDPSITRLHWAADSFQGLPQPTQEDLNGPLDTGAQGRYKAERASFEANVRNPHFGLTDVDKRMRVLEGWFNETLPEANISHIAFLRLDGDLYASTMDALEALYDRVSPGGLIYIDDYGGYTGCMRAVDEFRAKRQISTPLNLQALPEGGRWDETFRWEAAWFIKPPCPAPAETDPLGSIRP